MITTQSTVQLSVEEMALAMSLAGMPETGKLFLYSAYGELSGEDESSRLYAAGHSLVARDLIYIVEGRAELSHDMKRIFSILTESEYSIQYVKQQEGLANLVYAVQGADIIEQASKQGVAYELTEVRDEEQIADGGIKFFGIGANATGQYPEASMPVSLLEELKAANAQPVEAIVGLLQTAGLPDQLSQPLAEDLHEPVYHGAVLRMDNANGELRSESGIFTLGGKDRSWLFPLFEKEGEVYVRVEPSSASTFKRELAQLMQS